MSVSHSHASWGRRFFTGLASLGRSRGSLARLSDAHLSDIGAHRDTSAMVDIGLARIVARTPFPFC